MMVLYLNSLVMLSTKSKIIMRMFNYNQGYGDTHGKRVGNLSKIESVCDPHVRTYRLCKDGHYPLHFHQDYKISVQVKLFLSMTTWKLRKFCPVTGQVIKTDKRLIQLKTGNCKLGVL